MMVFQPRECILCLTLLFTGALLCAAEPNLAPITQGETVTTEEGTFSAVIWSKRDDFPALHEMKPITELPDGVSFTADADGVSFHTNGRASLKPEYDWAPMLRFTPDVSGVFALSGSLHIRSAGEAPEETVQWAVVRLKDGKMTPLATGTAGNEDVIDLATQRTLQSISLDVGESLGVTVWRRTWHWNGGGTLSDFSITRIPPPEGSFVQVYDGHLYRKGKRVRLWGEVGSWCLDSKNPDAKKWIDEEVVRLKQLGFNCVRLWDYPDATPYTKGDNSRNDLIDYTRYKLKQAGFLIWAPGICDNKLIINKERVAIVDDPATAAAWQEAVGEKSSSRPMAPWDARIRALIKENIKRILTHVNPYTGIAFGQDESVAIYELTNEEWWFSHMSKGDVYKTKPFFQKTFLARWNRWLKDQYGNDTTLRQAWTGSLLETESIVDETVMFIPPDGKGQTDEQMKLLGVKIPDYAAGKLTPADFSRARNSDAIRFLLEMQIEYKTDLYDYIRTLAPNGVGCNVSPIILDTGFGYDMQSPYLHMHGDASAHDVYISGFTPEKQHPRYPWFSGVEEPPRLYHDNPWLEQNHVRGKPFFVYEIGFFKPSKYFAEFPMRVVALAAIQDWDVVIWHYWGHPQDPAEEERYSARLQYCTPHHYWQGVHFQSDEIQSSQMRVAAEMFKNGTYAPAKDPTVFVFGADSVYDPEKIRFGKLGGRLAPTAYRYGSRIDFDPNSKEDYILGPVVPRGREGLAPVVQPTDEIKFAWHESKMVLDGPRAKSVVGFLEPNFTFDGDVTLRNIHLANEPGDLTAKERYVCFAAAGDDGKPLTESDRIWVSLVSTAKNTGFEMNLDKLEHEFNPLHLAKCIKSHGKLPVMVERVGATLHAPWLKGKKAVFYDFHYKVLKEVDIESTLKIPSDLPVFVVEISK